MRRLSLVITVGLVAYTALAMVYYDTFPDLVAVNVGPIRLFPFDLVFYPALVVLAIELFRRRAAPFSPRTRWLGYVVAVYVAFQIMVILPVAVIAKGLTPMGVFHSQVERLSMILVLFFGLVVTRYWSGRVVSRLFEWAAIALAVVAVWRFLAGTGVAVEAGTGRLRVLWGGATLLFGWLLISRLLSEKLKIRDFLMAMVGVAGVVLINHRSAYLALAVSILAYLVSRRRHLVRTIGIAAVVVLLFGLAVSAFFPALEGGLGYSFRTMLNPSADANTIDRVQRYRLGLDAFAAYPLGDTIWRPSYYLVDLGKDLNYEPHNFVIQLLVKEGAVGFVAWSALLAITLSVAFRNARRDNESAIFGSYLVFYLVFCLFNANFYMSNNIVLLSAAMGLIIWRDRLVAAQEHEACRRASNVTDVSRDQPAPGLRDYQVPQGRHRRRI